MQRRARAQGGGELAGESEVAEPGNGRARVGEGHPSEVNQTLTILYVVLGLSIMIAALGNVKVLALSVIERTRDNGLVSAVGGGASAFRDHHYRSRPHRRVRLDRRGRRRALPTAVLPTVFGEVATD